MKTILPSRIRALFFFIILQALWFPLASLHPQAVVQGTSKCDFLKSEVLPQIFSNPVELLNVADNPQFQSVLPGIRYAWADTVTKLGILIGWQSVPDTLSFGSTKNQFLLAIRSSSDPLVEAKKKDPMTLAVNTWIEEEQPITIYYDFTYVQDDKYTDFTAVIFHSRSCSFSIKFSGDASSFTEENKNLYFKPEINRYRKMLLSKSGAISFSSRPLLFNPSLAESYFVQLLLINALTAIVFFIIRKRIICTYQSIAIVYSSIITGLALVMSLLILLLILSDLSSPLKGGYILDLSLLVPIGFVFLLHLANLQLRKNHLLQYTLLYMIMNGIVGIVQQFTTMPIVNNATLVSFMFAIGFASFVAYKTFHKPSRIEG